MYRLLTITLLLLVLALPSVASAYNLSWDDYSYSGLSVTASGGSLATKVNEDGTGSLGVSGGVGGEISIGQSMTFAFDQTQVINNLDLSLLYANGGYGDVGNEVAQVTANYGGNSITYTLTVTGATTAVWSGSDGSVVNVSAGVTGSGGVWSISNPFGSLSVDSILLTALDNGVASNLGSTNSDFGFYAMNTTATPIPAAAWLLGSGLLGLLGVRRYARA